MIQGKAGGVGSWSGIESHVGSNSRNNWLPPGVDNEEVDLDGDRSAKEPPMEDLPILSQSQARAIAALMTQSTLNDAARAAGVGLRTLQQWMAEDRNFVAHYRNARRAIFAQTVKALQARMPAVTDRLFDLVHDPAMPLKVRIAASKTLLGFSFRAAEVAHVQEAGEKVRLAQQTARELKLAAESQAPMCPTPMQQTSMQQTPAAVDAWPPDAPPPPAPRVFNPMEPLTQAQERAVVALLQHPTVAEAARGASVGLRSLRRWLRHHENFQTHYDNARREVFEEVMRSVQDRIPSIVERLYEFMSNDGVTGDCQVIAARALLDYGQRGIDLLARSERIENEQEALEAEDRARGAGATEPPAGSDETNVK